jgi:hypothetical protein
MKFQTLELVRVARALASLLLSYSAAGISRDGITQEAGTAEMSDIQATAVRLKNHLNALTVAIGKRSVRIPGNLMKTVEYVRGFCEEIGYPREGNFIGTVEHFDSRGLTRSLLESFQKNPDLPVIKLTVPFNGWIRPAARLSDHASFWDEGFQAVMITDSAFYRDPHHHQPTNQMDTLDCRFMAELTQRLVAFMVQARSASCQILGLTAVITLNLFLIGATPNFGIMLSPIRPPACRGIGF